MLPCFISSSKKLALRSRCSTEWAASAGRNTEREATGTEWREGGDKHKGGEGERSKKNARIKITSRDKKIREKKRKEGVSQ